MWSKSQAANLFQGLLSPTLECMGQRIVQAMHLDLNHTYTLTGAWIFDSKIGKRRLLKNAWRWRPALPGGRAEIILCKIPFMHYIGFTPQRFRCVKNSVKSCRKYFQSLRRSSSRLYVAKFRKLYIVPDQEKAFQEIIEINNSALEGDGIIHFWKLLEVNPY